MSNVIHFGTNRFLNTTSYRLSVTFALGRIEYELLSHRLAGCKNFVVAFTYLQSSYHQPT